MCTWKWQYKKKRSRRVVCNTTTYSSRKPNTVASTPQSRNPSNTEKTSKNGEDK